MSGNATSTNHAAASAADRAYAEIRGLILAGDASPGTPLREEALADIVGVSRTPIRDALRRLEVELYAVRTPGGRLVVADWDSDDVAEIFALRAMLEGHAAARAARRVSPAQLAETAPVQRRHRSSRRAAATGYRALPRRKPPLSRYHPERVGLGAAVHHAGGTGGTTDRAAHRHPL